MTRTRLLLTALVAATLIGLIGFGSTAFLLRADHAEVPFYEPLIWELSSTYTLVFLLPLIWWTYRRYPWQRGNLARAIPAHAITLLLFSALHTLGMVHLRKAVYVVAGLGSYEYGSPLYRSLMELNKDALTYFSIILIFSAVDWWRRGRDASLRNARLQADLRESQLQALRAQLDPHFLFNALNAVSDVMYEDVERADRILSSLSRLLRFSLDNQGSQTHALKRELEILGLYLEVMRARFPDRLTVSVSTDESLADWPVPVLILQPLVENAIKHHPRTRGTSMAIDVAATPADGRLMLTVTDNGGGPDQPLAVLQKRGVGLDNTIRRLTALYGGSASFQLEKVANQGRAELLMPAETLSQGGHDDSHLDR